MNDDRVTAYRNVNQTLHHTEMDDPRIDVNETLHDLLRHTWVM